MRKGITKETVLMVIFYASGYELGNLFGKALCRLLGIRESLIGTLGFVVGIVFSALFGKIGVRIFDIPADEREQAGGNPTAEAKRKRLITIVGTAAAFFIICEIIARVLFGGSLVKELISELVMNIGVGVLITLYFHISRQARAAKIRKKYGHAEEGIIFDIDKVRQLVGSQFGVNLRIPEGYDTDLLVKCRNGSFSGVRSDDCVFWKGIPYAKAPIGELRWKAPVPCDESSERFEAKYFGPSEPQEVQSICQSSFYAQNEDCLSLNIWRSAEDMKGKKLHPVVWLTGGDYSFGGSADFLYDGEPFIEAHPEDILVTVNYRFGLFGLINFEEVEGGSDYPDAPNLAVLDVIAALKWVKENIASFGGDPDDITLIGDRSGASLALQLPVIPAANDLFKRVIALSGTPGFSISRERSLELTRKLCEYFNIHDMTGFKLLTDKDLVRAAMTFDNDLNSPMRDGKLIPENIFEEYAKGAAKDIGIIAGSCADEIGGMTFWAGNDLSETYRNAIGNVVSEIDSEGAEQLQLLLADFKKEGLDDRQAMSALYNYAVYHSQLVTLCRCQTEAGGSARFFFWNIASPIRELGAFAGSQIPFVMNNPDSAMQYAMTGDAVYMETWAAFINNFIEKGDPSIDRDVVDKIEKISWPDFAGDSKRIMVMDEDHFAMGGEDILSKCDRLVKFHRDHPELLGLFRLQ